jgi:hypothetical protein
MSATARLRAIKRLTGLLAAAGLLVASATTASAYHIGGTLDCGSEGTFTTHGTDWLPPGFQAPQGTVFLLEGTNQRFVVFQWTGLVSGNVYDVAPGRIANKADGLIACDFTYSDGTEPEARVLGMFTPQR